MESDDSELTWQDLAHWLTVGGVSEATLASAIEQYGIWGFDRFGRFRQFPPESADKVQTQELTEVFDALAANYAASQEQGAPLPAYDLWGTEVYCRFGWPAEKAPDFKAIAAQQSATVPTRIVRAAHGKRQGNDLRLIAALLEFIQGICTHNKHPDFTSEAALRAFLVKRFNGYSGFGERHLQAVFAQAKRAFED